VKTKQNQLKTLSNASLRCTDYHNVRAFWKELEGKEMAHSAVPFCGACGGEYRPSRGGWSHGRIVLPHYQGLRAGAQAGDPLHDTCYQAIYKTMRSAQQLPQRKRKRDDAALQQQPAAAIAPAAAAALCPKGCSSYAKDERSAADLLAQHFKAEPIATLHAAAPARDVMVAHIPKTQVGSADAAASTVQKRSSVVEHVLHAVAVPPPTLTAQRSGVVSANGAVSAAVLQQQQQQQQQQQLDAQRHLNAQRQSVVKRALPAYTAAVESASGFRIGPLTVDELMELKKFTGYVLSCNCSACNYTARNCNTCNTVDDAVVL
jgi:hypothetical protein